MIIEAEYEEVEPSDGELDLTADDSLPWLESEEEDDGVSGVDVAQIIGFALILLVILAGVVGAVWHFGNQSGDSTLIADGSTIQAPEGPIKERPEDPGGKEFDGTGNVAPVVGEGGTRDGVMDTGGSDAAAAEADGASGSDSDAGAATASGTGATSATGVGVQLAAYTSRARAEQGWNDLSRRTDALAGARYRIEQGTVDIGTVYRLQAVASDRAAADRMCAALKADGLDCQVKP